MNLIIFSHEKTSGFTKVAQLDQRTCSQELRRILASNEQIYAPLQVAGYSFSNGQQTPGAQSDAVLKLAWNGRSYDFLVQIITRTTPKFFRSELERQNERAAEQDVADRNLLIVVPNLDSTLVNLLREAEFSGADLNGNYIIQTQDLVAVRLDQERKYLESRPIKNVFRGKSSIVCRFFLTEAHKFERVTEIYDHIQRLGGEISLSTVSKVLSALDSELIIEKNNVIRLLQPQKLLANLRAHYEPTYSGTSLKLKLPPDRVESERILDELLGNTTWVWDGQTSAERYATTTPAADFRASARDVPIGNERIAEFEAPRFYNCIVNQSRESFLYFDCDGHWSSEVETYLALSQGGKREQDIARDIEDRILKRLEDE